MMSTTTAVPSWVLPDLSVTILPGKPGSLRLRRMTVTRSNRIYAHPALATISDRWLGDTPERRRCFSPLSERRSTFTTDRTPYGCLYHRWHGPVRESGCKPERNRMIASYQLLHCRRTSSRASRCDRYGHIRMRLFYGQVCRSAGATVGQT